ncbi:MAG: DUF4215 domain-containing protein, partial [Sandaracinaceae bacterium]
MKYRGLAVLMCVLAVGCDFDDAFEGDGGPGDASTLDGSRPDGDVSDDGGAGVCGDGTRSAGEVCDDGNTTAGDGCAADCSAVEDDFACGPPGRPCVRVVTCGNARIEGDETCDDRNTVAGDGCDADCRREPGWVCPVVGAACVSAR